MTRLSWLRNLRIIQMMILLKNDVIWGRVVADTVMNFDLSSLPVGALPVEWSHVMCRGLIVLSISPHIYFSHQM